MKATLKINIFFFNWNFFFFFADILLKMESNRILILTLLMIGLASAQVNFSTSWGKRSPATSSQPAASSAPSYRQNFHAKKEPATLVESQTNNQHNNLPESYDSLSSTIYDDAEEQQRISVSLPSPCLSLLKSLMLVNQIVEVIFHNIILILWSCA